jgi:hypothetical protein
VPYRVAVYVLIQLCPEQNPADASTKSTRASESLVATAFMCAHVRSAHPSQRTICICFARGRCVGGGCSGGTLLVSLCRSSSSSSSSIICTIHRRIAMSGNIARRSLRRLCLALQGACLLCFMVCKLDTLRASIASIAACLDRRCCQMQDVIARVVYILFKRTIPTR